MKLVFGLVYVFLLMTLWNFQLAAQNGTLSGQILDADSESPLPFATVSIAGSSPLIGTISNENGEFVFNNLELGRVDLIITCIGYYSSSLKGILVSSGRSGSVQVRLKEAIMELGQADIIAFDKKEDPINKMASVSARQLTVEESRRYAGGFDDPARLVSSFAGVAGNISSNGIVIRGNAPKGVLWRIEGMQVSNPNHFAEITGLGAGVITALSSQMLANSDFFTGAFPAEYGNAYSGVFDLSLRNGNNLQSEHTFQAGIIGIDFASEGPFKKGKLSSYLFNYRYSTFGLISPILPEEAGEIGYQDLSFKINFPKTLLGNVSIWGLGLLDKQNSLPVKDSTEWEYARDLEGARTRLGNGIIGLSSKRFISDDWYLKFTASASGDLTRLNLFQYDDSYDEVLSQKIKYKSLNYRFNGLMNKKFNQSHTNRTGFTLSLLGYDVGIKGLEQFSEELEDRIISEGSTLLIQTFSQSSFAICDKFQCNPGVHLQYFALNENVVIEPRISFRYKLKDSQHLSLAYGKHSQLEKLNYYLEEIQVGNERVQANRNLDFSKAHHLILAYDRSLTEHSRLKAELYFQQLYNIPVIADSSFSFINLRYDWFIGAPAQNTGKGENYGVELTLERFLHKGWYYLLTTSIFKSSYTGGDGIWRSTVFDQRYIANILVGKEWISAETKNKVFNASARYTLMGGERLNPVLEQETLLQGETVEDFQNAFSISSAARNLLHLSFSYRVNHQKFSGIWSLQVLNALGSSEQFADQYNFKYQRIDSDSEVLVIPNLSYKIEF